MKKKFIAVYALIGVLALGSTTLTSCVDDNESASVTAVRDAKAAQLNALAALNNAKAEAKKITAEAEAAYKAAETRWQEIQNELKDLELQKAKARLETDLKTAQLKAEAALMDAQKQMEEAKAQLIQALDRVDEANKARINVLIGNANAILNGGSIQIFDANSNAYITSTTINPTYTTSGTNSIVALRSQLLVEERNLILYNYDLKDLDVAIADYLNEQEATKAEQEALKADYEELKANSSREAIEAKYTDAKAAQAAASKAEQAANETEALKSQAVTDYQNDIIRYNEINNATVIADYQTTYSPYVSASGDVAILISSGTIGVGDFLSLKDPKDDYKTVITFDDGAVLNYTGYYVTSEREFSEEDSKLLGDLLTFISRDIDVYTNEVVNANQKNLNDAITANQANLTTLNNTLTTAKATYEADKSTANFNALQAAQQAVDDFEVTYGIAPLRTTLENSQTILEAKQEAQAVITKVQTLLTGDAMTEYAEQYAELYKLQDEYFAAEIEYLKADHNLTVANTLVGTLARYVDAAPATDLIPDWDDLIAACDKAIRDAEENIELVNGTDMNGTSGNNLDAKQALIDKTEADIERIKIQIEQQEAQYESYMQQAQELIENGSTIPDVEVPETPSEDEGTDTPAE